MLILQHSSPKIKKIFENFPQKNSVTQFRWVELSLSR